MTIDFEWFLVIMQCWIGSALQVFIGCPSSNFSHKISALGGVRVIAQYFKREAVDADAETFTFGLPAAALPDTETIDLTGQIDPHSVVCLPSLGGVVERRRPSMVIVTSDS